MRGTGTLRWFDFDRDVGFICPDVDGPDVRFQRDSIAGVGLIRIEPGQRVQYERVENGGRGRPEAHAVWFAPVVSP